MMYLVWNWLRRNNNLVLSLCAAACLATALGKVVRGATWSLMVPVSLAAVVCGWGLGSSRLNPKQAWGCLTGLGIPAVFIYVSGLAFPIERFFLASFSLVPQIIFWLSERTLVDIGPFIKTWIEMSDHASNVLIRLWMWSVALANGTNIVDPVAVALVWNLLLWLAGAWSGWQLRRYRQALNALTPGGVLLALVIDYTRGEIGLVVVYLAIWLVLVGLSRNDSLQMRWQQRKVDYSDSVVFETLLMVGMLTTGLVLSAAGTPSLSWRELRDKLRQEQPASSDQVAESLGLETPPNAANEPAYRSDGLPRQHLLDMPPEQLKDVVLVVSTGEIPPLPESNLDIRPERYYWRAITYDTYTGEGWRSGVAQDTEYPANSLLLVLPQDYRLLTQHLKRAPDENAYVYWTGILAQVDQDIRIAWRAKPPADPNPASNGDMLGALTAPDEYTVISYVSQFGADRLRTSGNTYPSAISQRYLRLPESVPERVLGLAREVTQAALTPYDRAVAIETYLRSFPYTLEVERPPSGRDVVDYFLFTAQQGYCDYYATAMAVLARAVGLPARIVVGYSSGEYDAQSATYIIRKENAHSWAEVYFSGFGWVEFEPTAAQPLIERLGGESASGPSPGLPAGKQAISWLKTRWRDLVTSLGGQLLVGMAGLALLFFLWQVGELGVLHLLPAPSAIRRMYSRLEKSSAPLLPDLPGGHTPYQFQAALTERLSAAKNRLLSAVVSGAEGEIKCVVSLQVRQVFTPCPPEKTQIRAGIRAWARLRWRLWIANKWFRYLAGGHTVYQR